MIKAVIFDMDGVLIDSEPLWQRAEREMFTSLGVNVTDELMLKSKGMSTTATTEFWYRQKPWHHISKKEAELSVIRRVGDEIRENGKSKAGIYDALELVKRQGVKIGLATNSPLVLIDVVMNKLRVGSYFDTTVSFEDVSNGKPEPDVYLKAAANLQTDPSNCLVIEDSATGLEAAKKAGMKVILIPEVPFETFNTEYSPDLILKSLKEFDSNQLLSFPRETS